MDTEVVVVDEEVVENDAVSVIAELMVTLDGFAEPE